MEARRRVEKGQASLTSMIAFHGIGALSQNETRVFAFPSVFVGSGLPGPSPLKLLLRILVI